MSFNSRPIYVQVGVLFCMELWNSMFRFSNGGKQYTKVTCTLPWRHQIFITIKKRRWKGGRWKMKKSGGFCRRHAVSTGRMEGRGGCHATLGFVSSSCVRTPLAEGCPAGVLPCCWAPRTGGVEGQSQPQHCRGLRAPVLSDTLTGWAEHWSLLPTAWHRFSSPCSSEQKFGSPGYPICISKGLRFPRGTSSFPVTQKQRISNRRCTEAQRWPPPLRHRPRFPEALSEASQCLPAQARAQARFIL